MNLNSCVQGSICFELIKGVPTALVALIIGLIASFVAWKQKEIAKRQKEIAEAKLKLDLFGRRYDIYVKVSDFIKDVSSNGTRKYPKFYDPFKDISAEVNFLFGKDVFDFVLSTAGKFILLQGAQERELNDLEDSRVPPAGDINREDWYKAWKEIDDVKEWFRLGCYRDLGRAFGPYLSFDIWK